MLSSCRGYRGLYILNWIYRYFTEPHFVHWISMFRSLSLSTFLAIYTQDMLAHEHLFIFLLIGLVFVNYCNL